MPNYSYHQALITAQADGTALSNSTAATSILNAATKFSLPANFFSIGAKLRIRAQGRISTLTTTPGTLTLDVRFGAVIVANGGAMSLNIVAKTNVPWWLDWDLTCRSIGASTSATMMHQGMWTSEAVVGANVPTVSGVGTLLVPVATPAVGTGFDSTSAQIVDLFGTWSIANAANSIQVHQFELISDN